MAPSGPKLPPKKEVGLALLERASVFVHLDPRREEVRVPKWLKKQPQLVLQIGLNMPVPIPDLSVEDDAISCTLSFSRSPFFCFVPWSAVYALVGEDGRGMVWPDDVPEEVAAQSPRKQPSKGPGLRVVEGDAGETDSAAEDARPPKVADLAAHRSSRPAPLEDDGSPKTAAGAERQSAPPPRPALAVAPDEPEPELAEAEEPEPDGDEGRDERTASDRKKKGKRELPSYLRVVK